MKDIKFRGKRVDNGEWVYGYYSRCDNDHYIYEIKSICIHKGEDCWENDLFKVEVIPESVGQYINKKDKNGVEVYTGDVINCSVGCPHVIEWYDEVPSSALMGGGMPGFYLSGMNEGYAWLDVEEVIGNMTDNPELLNTEVKV